MVGGGKVSGGADRRENKAAAGKTPVLSGAAGDKDMKDNSAKSGPPKKAPTTKV